jgi:Tol biopolymer transport system component
MNMLISIISTLMLLPTESFAADQGRIIFSTAYSGKSGLLAVRSDGKDLKQIADTIGVEHLPAVSPDGKELLFIDAQRNHPLSGLIWR